MFEILSSAAGVIDALRVNISHVYVYESVNIVSALIPQKSITAD